MSSEGYSNLCPLSSWQVDGGVSTPRIANGWRQHGHSDSGRDISQLRMQTLWNTCGHRSGLVECMQLSPSTNASRQMLQPCIYFNDSFSGSWYFPSESILSLSGPAILRVVIFWEQLAKMVVSTIWNELALKGLFPSYFSIVTTIWHRIAFWKDRFRRWFSLSENALTLASIREISASNWCCCSSCSVDCSFILRICRRRKWIVPQEIAHAPQVTAKTPKKQNQAI